LSGSWVVEAPVRVGGEECPRCVDSALQGLRTNPGVRAVERDPRGRILVRYDPDRVTQEELQRIVGAAPEGLDHRVILVRGMDCPDCAATIEAVLNRTPGIRFASLNYAAQRLLLEYDSSQITLPSIERVIRRLGYRVPAPEDPAGERPLAPLGGRRPGRGLDPGSPGLWSPSRRPGRHELPDGAGGFRRLGPG
jgi:Cd2+/Zn2+-exporting ATPase